MRIQNSMAVSTVMHKYLIPKSPLFRRRPSHVQALLITVVCVGSLVAGVSGCRSDNTGPTSSNGQDFWALQLNVHAATIALTPPYDTLHLQATPVNSQGNALPGVWSVRYRIAGPDTSIHLDSLTGLVTANIPSYVLESHSSNTLTFSTGDNDSVAAVVATLTIHGSTRADTMVVRVTATVPGSSLDTFSIQPPPDSLAIYQSGNWLTCFGSACSRRLGIHQASANGTPIDNPVMAVTTSDPQVASAVANQRTNEQQPKIIAYQGGKNVMIYAQTRYYGVDKRDSLLVKIGYPNSVLLRSFQETPLNSLTPQAYWWPIGIDVNAPAEIGFENDSYVLADGAIFDDPADILQDTAQSNNQVAYFGFNFPVSVAGNVAPFFQDTTGQGTACAAAQYDGTTNQADSTCTWTYLNGFRYVSIVKPGTYHYHNAYGYGGTIRVH